MPKLPRPSLTPPALWSDAALRFTAVLAIVAVGAIGFGVGWLVFEQSDEEPAPAPTAAGPAVIVETAPEREPSNDDEAVEQIGFPSFATRNTTRVGGVDGTSTASGVALASYPSQGGVPAPQAAILAPADSWQIAMAATPLTADPVAAPLLLSEEDDVPPVTATALGGLAPSGLEREEGAQILTVGKVAAPDDLETLEIEGSGPAEVADAIDRERAKLTGEKDPDHLLVVSSEDSAAPFSMPAAAWAARSGDPVLFVTGDDVPEATKKTIERHPKVPVYVLGPESVIPSKVVDDLRSKDGTDPIRIGAEDPVANSIEFARFLDGDFGWNINDPGHGFVIANADRPIDAAAAAPLSAGGKPGPLLITDESDSIPPELEGFLLDTKPGFEEDPTRAIYNHVWVIGDPSTISINFQARVDELTKLVPVDTGTGDDLPPLPGAPEDEADPNQGDSQQGGGGSSDGSNGSGGGSNGSGGGGGGGG